MRRLLLAAVVVLGPALHLAGCGGPNPTVDAPLIKDTLKDFARAVVNNDKDKIRSYILPMAGLTGNPLKAKDWDTAEGRDNIIELNRRDMRKIFKDSGILAEGDVDRFIGALRIGIGSAKGAEVRFDIAGGNGQRPWVVTFRMAKVDAGWRIHDYYREMQ